MNSPHPTPFRAALVVAMTTAAVFSAAASPAVDAEPMPEPAHTIVDPSIDHIQRDAMTLAARRYFAFWNTGDAGFARRALSPAFVDRTLPPGRPQGLDGPLFASRQFREAVPDLKAEVLELMLVGDRAVARLRFKGHYTGVFQGKAGDGRSVDFLATDIYRVADGQIAENWHLEDNLTLLQQLGVVHP